MSLDRPVLRSRKPTAAVPWPLILVEGEEKAGKSWLAALLTTSKRVGLTYWLDLGEGAGDEYAAIPGTRYEVLEHDGTYAQVLEQVLAVKAEAKRAADAGEPPICLVVDSGTDIWNGLKDWVSLRARQSAKNKAKLAEDAAAELDVSRNLWNDAASRYRRLLTQFLTFPGIVVVTARGKIISGTDPATGQPFRDGRKDYSVESHKTLPYDATLWLRLSRTEPPVIVGARSVHAGVKPGTDEPVRLAGPRKPPTDNVLEWLVFDVLKCDPAGAHVRDLKGLTGGDLLPEEAEDEAKRKSADQPAPTTPQQQAPPATRPPAAATPPSAPPDAAPTSQAPENLGEAQAPEQAGREALLGSYVEQAAETDDVDLIRNLYRAAGPKAEALLDGDVTDLLEDDDPALLGLTAPVTLGAFLMAIGKRLAAGDGPLSPPVEGNSGEQPPDGWTDAPDPRDPDTVERPA